jgi:hypothetical protein
MTDDDTSIIDHQTVACLADCGQRDYVAAAAISADGGRHLVLAAVRAIGDQTVRYDPECRDIEHEQPGQLPPPWRARVHRAPIRCGRPTLAGGHCRIPVGAPGQACAWHRAAP